MKLIILAALVALVFGDHYEGHQSKSVASTLHDGGFKQAIKYGIPFDAEVIFNPLTKGSKSEHKENKAVTITSSSSHSHTFKNKTSYSNINHVSKPDGSVFHDLPVPHKNVVSFISHHSTYSNFSNRTKDKEYNNNKAKSFDSGSTQENLNHVSRIDDGSYKPDAYGHALDFNDRLHSQTDHGQQIIKSTQLHNVFTSDSRDKSSSNFDDGSYKPELHKSLDHTSHITQAPSSGIVVFNDGSYKQETIRAHQIMKTAQQHDKQSSYEHSSDASNYDDGTYKPELYKAIGASVTDDGLYKQELSHDDQIMKSAENRDKHTSYVHSSEASNYDDGSYRPELYKKLEKTSLNTYGFTSGAQIFNDGSYKHKVEHQIIKSPLHTGHISSNDGLYKPELHKSFDQSHGSGVFNDGSYKQEAIRAHQIMKTAQQHDKQTSYDHSSDAANYDDGTYKPELYKAIGASVTDDGLYKQELSHDDQIMKSAENRVKETSYVHSSEASNYDDGSYKPDLYKRLDDTSLNTYGFANVGSYKHKAENQIIKSSLHTGQVSSNDGSYKPELHKSLDQSHASGVLVYNDGSYKQEAIRAHQIMKTAQQHDKQTSYGHSSDASKYDDGTYKPELYKAIGASVTDDGLYKQELSHDDQIMKSAENRVKETSYVHSSEASNYDDGSYRPELYKKLEKTSLNTYGFTSGAQIFNDGSYKHKVEHQIIKSPLHTGHISSNDGLYKPELHKSFDQSHASGVFNDGSYKQEAIRAHQIMKTAQQHDKQTSYDHSSDAANYDDGTYKPELYKAIGASVTDGGLYKQELSHDDQIMKSAENRVKETSYVHSSEASNYDDGSYKPDLYKRLDDTSLNTYGFANVGSYKHEAENQIIKSAVHTGLVSSNEGSYKPELHKSTDQSHASGVLVFNDGSYKQEAIRAHQIMKTAQQHDKQTSYDHYSDASNYDDGTYKPELYKAIGASVTDDGLYKQGLSHDDQIMKSAENRDKQTSYVHSSEASNYDDGSYKPDLYKRLDDTSLNTYGFANVGSYKHEAENQIIKSAVHTGLVSSNEGSYKPELHKSTDQSHASGVLVYNDGSYKQEAIRAHQIMKTAQQHDKQTSYGHSSDASKYDDGTYKPELYKAIGASVTDDGLYKQELSHDDQIMKSAENRDKQTSYVHSSEASNYDDGSYKPELYKIVGLSVSNDGVYKQETSHAQQIMKSAEHLDKQTSYVHSSEASNYDDGSYKPELYKSLDQSIKNSYKHETSHDQKIMKSTQYLDELTSHVDKNGANYDDGTYKPELYKTLDALVPNDGLYKSSSQTLPYETSRISVGSYRDEYSSPPLTEKLSFKPHNEYGIPDEYKN